jgi:predicted Zn-dependent protease
MQTLFTTTVEHALRQLRGSEVLLANFAGEVSDFVRFNHARVRQAMTVRQAQLELTLIDGQRRDAYTLALAGDPEIDHAAIGAALEKMRTDLPSLPEDPYLLYCTEPLQSTRDERGHLPAPAEAIDAVTTAAQGLDLVGILASGPVYRGFASSLGARHWHAVESFLFDWSLYHATDKAVKSTWGGNRWDQAQLRQRIDAARAQLAVLARPARTLAPGEYRAYLSPAAVDELLAMLNWAGVSDKAQRTKQSCVQKLVDGEDALSPQITLAEDIAQGVAPAFDMMGFARPPQVELIRAGRHAGSLVNARTAAEYGVAANGAEEDESMQSATLAGGSLPQAEAAARLDTGLYVGNLHYLNFSDRPNGRITGMTRFATFWVEGGEITAPVNVMRWDDTLYRMLGSELEALTDAPEWIANTMTYERRSVQTSRVPGALLASMRFTL